MGMRSKLEGGLWGVLVGDALGLTFQFTSRLVMELNYPNPKKIQIISGVMTPH